MKINIVLYGIARDIIGASKHEFEVEKEISVSELLLKLKEEFPKFELLTSLLVAVNDEYAEQNYMIQENDEVVLIPPVSGG